LTIISTQNYWQTTIKRFINSLTDTTIATTLLILSAILSYACAHSVLLCNCIEWVITIVRLLSLTEYCIMFTIIFITISHIVFIYLYWYTWSYRDHYVVSGLLLTFIRSIFGLCTVNALLSLFICWDLLGLSSYLLVTYYLSHMKTYNSVVVMLTNRLGDIMFIVSLLLLLLAVLSETICVSDWLSVTLLFTLLYVFTKYVVSLFTSQLPAMMSVPTPVSALVHYSTLVRAGVIVILRLDAVQHMNYGLLAILCILAIMYVSISASVDNDIKVIIAWSTVSQVSLTLLFAILGLQELSWLYVSLHVAYKSSLFISVGSVLHHHYSQQDVRMSSLLWLRIVAALCIIDMLWVLATIGTIGWTSKDVVLDYCSISIFSVLVMSTACCSVIMTSVCSLRTKVWWGNIQNVSMLETLCTLLYVVLISVPVAVWRLQITIVTKYDKTVRSTYCCICIGYLCSNLRLIVMCLLSVLLPVLIIRA